MPVKLKLHLSPCAAQTLDAASGEVSEATTEGENRYADLLTDLLRSSKAPQVILEHRDEMQDADFK